MTQWSKIIGHEWAVQLLSAAIEHNRIGHAYLLTGPEQIGKTLLARTFAQALNCTNSVRPCGQCRTCQLIAQDRHPDVRVIEPAMSHRGKLTLKIDTIRQLQRDLNLAAYEASYKIAILRRFDAANINAANAFLKTLEEPPHNVILLLTAIEADVLLTTITSRCRVINLRPVASLEIQTHLQTAQNLPEAEAQQVAHLANGRIGWAIQASQQPQILETYQIQLNQLYEALNGYRVQRFVLADKLARKPEQLSSLLQTWLSWWRDLMLITQASNASATVEICNLGETNNLNKLAAIISQDHVLASLKQTRLALWQLQKNANTRLVLENLFLTYPLPPN